MRKINGARFRGTRKCRLTTTLYRPPLAAPVIMTSTSSTSILLLLLPSCVRCWSIRPPACLSRQGKHRECMTSPFVPGYELAGQGFDVATLRRKGANVFDVRTYLTEDATCTLHCNPLQGDTLQKVLSY